MPQRLIKIGFLISCMPAFLFAPAVSRAESSAALAALEKVEFFSFGGIGVVGAVSPGDKLFRELAASPNKAELFHTLWDKGNSQAKCYALIGLYWVKDPQADELAEKLVSSHVPVATARGCIVGTQEQVATFIDSIKSGQHLQYYFSDLLTRN